METPAPADAELAHLKEIGLTSEDSVVRKTFVPDLVKADEEKRTATFVISTGAVDRDNDTIKVEGWDVKNYLKNPVVLWAHDSSRPPVGKAVSVVKSAGTLKATVEFVPEGIYDLADTVYAMVKGGFLRATSVGFRPKLDQNGNPRMSWNEERRGVDFEEQELLEFSVVPVPSNPQALMDQAKDFAGASAAGIDLGPIRKALALADAATDKAPAWTVRYGGGDGSTSWTWAGGSGGWVETAPPVEEKAGRRLSSKTEASLRSAHKSASEAVGHLQEALGDAEEALEDGKAAEPEVKAPEPSPIPSEPSYPVPSDEAIQAAVKRAVSSAINRARGRLD